MKKIFKLENFIYLTVFLLPTYLLRFSIFGFRVNVLDCLLLGSIIWGFFVLGKKTERKAFFKRNGALIFSSGLILFGLSTSILVNKSGLASLGIIKSWFLLPVFFAFVASLMVEEDRRKNIFFVYYFSAFSVALVSLGYYFLGELTYDFRLQGFFNSPNYLAMYLAPTAFIFYPLLSEVSRKNKLLLYVSGLIILWTLYLTFSYASWLSIGLAFIFILAVKKELNWKRLLIILGLLMALVLSQAGKNKLSSLIKEDGRSSLSSRGIIWQSAGKMLKTNWLWGMGVGNFQEKYLEYQKYYPPYLEWAVPHPHSLYLTFWLYGGIFGFLGFLMALLFWFFDILKRQKKSQLGFIGLGIMLYILLHGLVDTTYFKNDLAVVFWLLFALL